MRQTLSEARQQLRSIRVLLWLYAAGYGLWAVLMLPAWGGSGTSDGLILGTGFVAAFALGAALFVHRRPFVWTVGLAVVQTVLVGVGLLGGGIPWFDALVALGLWGSVPLMRRAEGILREHGDEFSSADLVRRVGRRVPEGEVRAYADDVGRHERIRRARSFEYGVLIAAAVVVVAVGLFWIGTSSSTIDARLGAFADAWEAGDLVTVRAMCTNDYRRGSWSKVERVLVREGWDRTPPALGEPAFEQRDDSWAEVHFGLPRGKLRTKWIWHNSAWKLDGVIFSGLRD